MKGIIMEYFHDSSDHAIQQIIDQCPGRPVTNGMDGPIIGKIISGRRIEDTNMVEFEVEFYGQFEMGGDI
jgi:hypothetical protein